MKNKSDTKIGERIQKASYFIILALTILVPLVVIPFTSEFYEFNKSVIVILLGLVLFIIWGVKLAFTGELSFIKSDYDMWVGFIALSSFLSLIFARHFLTGIIGYTGRLSEGFVVLLCLLFISFVVRKIVDKKQILSALSLGFLISGAIVGFSRILYFYGFYFLRFLPGFDFAQTRNFSLLGSVRVEALFFTALVPFALAYFLTKSREVKKALPVLPLVVLIFGGFVFSTGNFWSFPALFYWIMAIAGISFVILRSREILKQAFVYLVIIFAFTVIFFLGRNIESLANSSTEDPYVEQPYLQQNIAWSVASGSISQSPLRGMFGNGPDSFAYSFTRYRPESYNETEDWNVRFSRSSNQLFEIMGNYGVVGLVVWIGFFIVVGIFMYKLLKENHAFPYNAYLAGLVSMLVILMLGSLFTYFTVSVWLLFWIGLSLLTAVRIISIPRLAEKINLSLLISREKIAVERHNVLPFIILIPLAITALFGLYGLFSMYLGDVHYRNAQISLNQIEEDSENILDELTYSYNELDKAIDTFPYRSDYYRNKALVSSQILEYLSLVPSEEIEDYKYEQERKVMLDSAINNSSKAIELNEVDVKNWEMRFSVYSKLLTVTNGNFGETALRAIQEAIEKDPVKPQLYHQYGVLLSIAGFDQKALDELKRAVELQPMLLDARFDLAMQFEKMGRFDEARLQLQNILEIMQDVGLEDTDAYKRIQDKIDTVGEGLSFSDDKVEDIDAGDLEEEDFETGGGGIIEGGEVDIEDFEPADLETSEE